MLDFKSVTGHADFYFVRHGKSTGNAENIIQGHRDYPLSEEGKSQAIKVGKWFRDKNISLILSSPLIRAKETAEIIKREAQVETLITDSSLMELNTGIFSGESLDDIPQKFPNEWKSFQQKSWEGVPGAETPKEIYKRAERYWKKLLSRHASNPSQKTNVLTVSHAGLIQWLIKVTFGHREWLPLFPMSNTGIFLFSIRNSTTKDNSSFLYKWELINHRV